MLDIQYRKLEQYKNVKTVFTIHNLKYQGLFQIDDIEEMVSLGELAYTADSLEFYGMCSFIKGGIVFADHITTVSPTYAQEIQTAAYAAQLRLRADDRLDADQVPVRQLGYPDKARPVLVCAREKRNKTGEVVDAQPPKGPRPRLANSLDVSQFRSELWHYVNLA